MGGEFGGERRHAYVWLSPFAVHLKLSQSCSLAISQYKIKSYKRYIFREVRGQRKNTLFLGVANLWEDKCKGFPGGSVVKNLPEMRETWV